MFGERLAFRDLSFELPLHVNGTKRKPPQSSVLLAPRRKGADTQNRDSGLISLHLPITTCAPLSFVHPLGALQPCARSRT